jgi:hypothetical protein
MKIEFVSVSSLRVNQAHLGSVVDIVRESYADPDAVLAAALADADTAYLGFDDSSELESFFLVRKSGPTISSGSGPKPTMYLGLSATRGDSKGSGRIVRLYRRLILDAQSDPALASAIAWGTTATPVAFAVVQSLFTEVEPRPDGEFTTQGAHAAAQLVRGLGREPDPNQPFVIRGLASYRYASAERERIAHITHKKRFTLFDRLGIDERRGDRLLLVCKVPAPSGGGRDP